MKPGIYDMPMGQYLALPYLSSGKCHTLLTCSPLHARYEMDHVGDDANEASDIGTAIHDGLLEGVDRIVALDFTDWRKKEAKELREATRASGKIPLLAHKAVLVKDCIEAAQAYVAKSDLATIFAAGKPEQTIIFEHDGVKCKARPDWNGQFCLHVKTTQGSAQPDAWIRSQLTNAGYDVAAAFYELATEREQVFLVIEQAPPFGCSLIALTPAMQAIAAAKVARAIATWRECERSGKWPCYPSSIQYAEPTQWQMAQAEEDMLTAEELKDGIPL
jgi:hypothetical protein